VLGLIFIGLGSLGNSVFVVPPGLRNLKAFSSLALIVVSVVVVAFGSIVPFFVSSDTTWWRTYGLDDVYHNSDDIVWFTTSYQLVFILGCVLVMMKITDVLLGCLPERHYIQGNDTFSKGSAPAGVRTDRALKQACSFKMVRRK
jgi:hypothetical protein